MTTEGGTSSTPSEPSYQLPWNAIPRFIPGTTDVTEYSKKLQFLAAMWPKESLSLLAPRAALLCEGTSFKKVSKLPADKLKSNDESGVQLLVATLGGSWGRSEVERKYDVFEKAIYGTIQKSDESNDSYLARHDVHFEELLAQNVSLEEIRAYVLLRQSALSAEDRKKIVVEMGGTLKYDKVSSAIRLLGSRFFSELQGQRGAFRNKTYDANIADEVGADETDRVYHAAAPASAGEEYEPELEPEYLEALVAAEDQDALTITSFEDELETFFQDTPELQEALVSYLEARSRLLSKRKVRGFWPVSGHKGAKASGKGAKGKGKGKSGRDQLLARIAKSTCRACGERGHWKAECPKYGRPGSMSSAPKNDATTTFAEECPAQATAYMSGSLPDGAGAEILTQLPEEAVSLAEAFRAVEIPRLSKVASRLNVLVKNFQQREALNKIPQLPRQPRSGVKTWTETLPRRHEDTPPAELCASEVALQSATTVEAILDTGASRCVMGHLLLDQFLSQLSDKVRSMVRVTKSSVRFRFGNNQTLVSSKRLLVPIRTLDHQVLWLGVEIVPGSTPLLFSKRAIKQLGGVIDTTTDSCCLRRLRKTFPLREGATGLYMLDLAGLSEESCRTEQQCQHVAEACAQSPEDKTEPIQCPNLPLTPSLSEEPCMQTDQPVVNEKPESLCTHPAKRFSRGPQGQNSYFSRFRKYPESVNVESSQAQCPDDSQAEIMMQQSSQQAVNSSTAPEPSSNPLAPALPDGPEQGSQQCIQCREPLAGSSLLSSYRRDRHLHSGTGSGHASFRARTTAHHFRKATEGAHVRGSGDQGGFLGSLVLRSSAHQHQACPRHLSPLRGTLCARGRSSGRGADSGHRGNRFNGGSCQEQSCSPHQVRFRAQARRRSLGHDCRSGVPSPGRGAGHRPEPPHEPDGRDDASDAECHSAAQHSPAAIVDAVQACRDEIQALLSTTPASENLEWIEDQAKKLLDMSSKIPEMKSFLRNVPWHRLTCSHKPARAILQEEQSNPKRPPAYVTFGTFVHGGIVGVTKVSREFPYLTKLLARLMSQTQPDHPFTSVSISCNTKAKPHRDSYNSLGIPNLVVTLLHPQSGGEIWVASPPGPNQKSMSLVCAGKRLSGSVRCLQDHLLLDPHVWHATLPWSGNRLLAVGFASKAYYKVSSEDRQWLVEHGFPFMKIPALDTAESASSNAVCANNPVEATKSLLRQELEASSPLLEAPALHAKVEEVVAACMHAFNHVQVTSWETFEDSLLTYQQPIEDQLDLLEVYAYADSRLTQTVQDLGGRAQRFTKEHGDLSTVEGQRKLWNVVQRTQPKHIWVAPDCRLWSSWSHFNASRSDKYNQQMLEGRQRDQIHLQLCVKLFEWQQRHKRVFHFEQPAGSMMLQEGSLQSIVAGTQKIHVDMCMFGLQTPVSKRPIKKATTILSTSPSLIRSLVSKQCVGHANHQPVAGRLRELGGKAVSQYVASYCPGFAEHVAKHLLQRDDSLGLVSQETAPVLTRKRFKTSEGAPRSLTSFRSQKRAANASQESVQRGQPSRRLEIPSSPPECASLPEAVWKPIFDMASSCTSRATASLVPPQHEMLSLLEQALPRYKVLQAFVGCKCRNYAYPLGALPATVAPVRISVAAVSTPGDGVEYKLLQEEPRSALSNEQKRCRITPVLWLITIFAQPLPAERGSVLPSAPGDAAASKLEGWGPPPIPLHGPAFRSLSSEEKTQLRRVHVNLGHPSPPVLARHLQAAKADPRLVEAAREFQCDSCLESTHPLHQRPSKLPQVREFNDLIGVDGFYFKSKAGYRTYVLHAIDEASCFQQGRRAVSRHATDAIQALSDFWVNWAGPPKQVYLDPAGEFRSEEVLEYFQGLNVKAHVTAAAWQRGRLERHGDILKDMLERVDISDPITSDSSFDRAFLQCILAKNALVRHDGYSPEQIVFGKALRTPGSIASDEDLTSHALAEGVDLEAERHRRRLELRCLAKKAFLEADNSQTIRRAALRRSTPLRGPFTPGMWVLYWTKKSSPNRLAAGRWHGPAKVICAEGKSIVWVAHGTTIIRSAPENLRPASLREWQSLTDSQLDSSWKNTGGASSFLDLTGLPQESAASELHPSTNVPTNASELMPAPSSQPVTANNVPSVPSTDEIGQPEQELTPQVSQEVPEVERDSVAAPSNNPAVPEGSDLGPPAAEPPDPQSIPVPESDEGLSAENIFLASEATGISDGNDSELVNFTFLEHDGEASGPPLAEDNLPYVLQPLQNSPEQAYCLEVPLKPKEVQRWRKERSTGHMIAVAAAMKRARSEVCLKDLSVKEQELFDQAKRKEINCWVQTSAIRAILRRKLNPEQILKSRWILTWKAPEEGETQRRAKARLVVLGFQDPKLTEVSRDAPTLSKEGRAVVLQTIASKRFQLSSFDIKTAFLRGKADASNPLAMEPPKELRKILGLKDDEVCELLGNAYGRVDAPLLFYKELCKQLLALGFTRHPLEPCVFTLYQGGVLRGILGMHVDDGVGGGDEVFKKKVDELQKVLPFGSRKFDNFTFTGIHLQQFSDGSIRASQDAYVRSIPHIDVGRTRRQNVDDQANEAEQSKLRGLIGSLQYAVTHTRPDMAAKLGEIQSQTSCATVQTLLAANRVLREAQETSQVSIRYLPIPVSHLTFVSFGDASFASAKNLHSHQGALICATDEKLNLNQEAPVSPVAWSSKKIPRVVRSTLSAEAYAMSKAVDILGWVRALWGCIHVSHFNWQQPEAGFKQLHTATIVTDCKSLYDLVTRLAMPSCEEFRTTLEVLLIKQRCSENANFRWIPTTLQVADSLTKPMDPALLRTVLAQGRFRLYDASENLNKTAQRREAVRWLSQPPSFSSTTGA